MARTTEDVGLLLVHGMGEQAHYDHLRSTARQLAASISDSKGLIRLNIRDETEDEKAPAANKADGERGAIIIDAVFRRDGAEEQIRLHLHEVWWADLGIRGGLVPQLKFWIWGLGQWAARVARVGTASSVSDQLMAMPRFGEQEGPMDPPSRWRQIWPRMILFAAGLLAFLTFFTWSAIKQVVAFLARTLPQPSLIFLYLGDVKIYTDSAGPRDGTMLDPAQPVRATIRRRMAAAMIEMAKKPHKKWYILAHSLGTVPAFNLLQETELGLPNYLTREQWAALPRRFKTKTPFMPAGVEPSPDHMMPRRPPWLGPKDGISRRALFSRFAGLVTYGSPLDKFATLWPRTVLLNRQAAIFPKDCEWVNLHDPTDPAAGRLDAFARPLQQADAEVDDRMALEPVSAGCRASPWFGISHTCYFRPRRWSPHSMPAAIAKALVSGGKLSLSQAAGGAAISRTSLALRWVWAIVQVVFASAALLALGGVLLLAVGRALPDFMTDGVRWVLGRACPHLLEALQGSYWSAVLASVAIAAILAVATVLIAGLWRAIWELGRFRR